MLALACLAASFNVGCVHPMLREGANALGQGRYDQAIDAFQSVQSERGNDLDVSVQLATAHRAKAADLVGQGHCVEAATHIEKADILTQPNHADYRSLYRCIEHHSADPKARLVILRRLVKIGERYGPILRQITLALLETDERDLALKYAVSARKRYALRGDDYRRIGFAFAAADRSSDALDYLQYYLRQNPKDALVRLKIAELSESLGELVDARRQYRALTADYPKNPVLFLRLAAFCGRHGDKSCQNRAQSIANELRGIRPQHRSLRPLLKSKR
jgi:tetratricopeptide (TPR) repeat protein